MDNHQKFLYSCIEDCLVGKILNDNNIFPKSIEELIFNLKDKNHELYVWTARDRYSCLDILKKLDLAKHFNAFYSSGDGPIKPSAHGLNELVGAHDKEKIIVICYIIFYDINLIIAKILKII